MRRLRSLAATAWLLLSPLLLTTPCTPIHAAEPGPELKADDMTTPQCSGGALLPAVLEMSDSHPQRIPYPAANEDEIGVYGKLTNGQRIAGHLPDAVRAGIGAQSGALLRKGSLDPGLREMIIIRTGYRIASLYEVVQHRSLAESLGIPAIKLDALACQQPQGLSASESAAIAFVDELMTLNRTNDSVLEAVRNHFSDGQVLEIIFVAGNWWTLGRMLETAGIPLDAGRIGKKGLVPPASTPK